MSIGRAYANCSYGQVHNRYAGTPGAPPLVLLHQTPSTSAMYETLMQRLAGDFRLIAPDTPGMGLSDPTAPQFSIAGAAMASVTELRPVAKRLEFNYGADGRIASADIIPIDGGGTAMQLDLEYGETGRLEGGEISEA